MKHAKQLKKIFALFFLASLATSALLCGGTFTVSSLTGDTNANGLYAAIANVNASSDPTNTILFSTHGTITLTTSLPSIINPVLINGFSAPTWSNVPVVSVNFNGTPGLLLGRGSDNSTLEGLSLVNASTAGVTVQSSSNSFYGNSIGIALDGTTVSPNNGGGLSIASSSSYNLVNYTTDGSTNFTYYSASNISPPVSYWQGLRGSTTTNTYLPTTNTYLICGTSQGTNGLLFIGNIEGTSGSSFIVNNPLFSSATSVYGPDISTNNTLRLVGSGRIGINEKVHGFIFEGSTNDFNNAESYTTVDVSGSDFNYVHSTMGNLAVLNSGTTNLVMNSGAYIYDVSTKKFVTTITYPNSLTDSAYGIWWNGGTSYTICGGYSTNALIATNQNQPYGLAFLVDYDSSVSGSNAFTHWSSYSYPYNTNFVSHFQGISAPHDGFYTLVANVADTSTSPCLGYYVTIPRQADGSFASATWFSITNEGVAPSANSVYGKNIVGVDTPTTTPISFQGVLNTVDVVNVMSGNIGSGIMINSSSRNLIAGSTLNANTAYGIFCIGNCYPTFLFGNTTSNNALGDYYLMHANGIIVNE